MVIYLTRHPSERTDFYDLRYVELRLMLTGNGRQRNTDVRYITMPGE
jgi:hypothetical protein